MAQVTALELLPRLARGVELVALITALGTLAINALIRSLPRAEGPDSSIDGALLGLFRGAAMLALVAMLAWLPVQALQIAGESRGWLLASLLVLTGTTFGSALAARFGLVVLSLAVAGGFRSTWRLVAALLLAGAALSIQPWLGHAAAADDRLQPVLIAAHVVAAGFWLGSLPALAIVIAQMPPDLAVVAARRFSWLGLAAIAVIAGTALPQSLPLIGDVGGLFGTPYGLTVLAKTAGLAGLLALAALNRFVLTPRIGQESGRRALVLSIAVEMALGAAVVAAAVGLASLPPGAHEQAVWPFAVQPDLSRIGEAYYARELWRGAAILAVVLGISASLLWRRTRLFGPVIGGAVLFWLPLPNFALLAKPAWPTSFQRSETGFAAAAILRGEALTRQLCTADCFKPRDDPSDPTPYALWQRGDGDLYGWLTDVFDRIGYSPFPHGTIANLSPRERWQLIDYFRARIAGSIARSAGNWPYPVLTPDFPVTCRDGRSSMRDLLGQSGGPVEIVMPGRDGAAPPAPALQAVALTRVLIARAQDDVVPAGFDCVSISPDATAALALVAGVDQEGLAGGRLLADANGWLRSRSLTLPVDDEKRTLTAWAAEIARVAAAPFDAGGIGTHRH